MGNQRGNENLIIKILFWLSVFAIFAVCLDAVTTATALEVWPKHFYESVPTSKCVFDSLGLYQGLAFMLLTKCLIIILFYHTTLPKYFSLFSVAMIGISSFYAGSHNAYLIINHVLGT